MNAMLFLASRARISAKLFELAGNRKPPLRIDMPQRVGNVEKKHFVALLELYVITPIPFAVTAGTLPLNVLRVPAKCVRF